MTTVARLLRRARSVHYLLLGVLICEFILLENVEVGLAHHLWDAILVIFFALAGWWISGRRSNLWSLLLLGGIPWAMDLLGIRWQGFDFESLFWTLFNTYLAFLIGDYLLITDEVHDTEIVAAVSLYLVAGFAFANLYSIILSHDPNALIHVSTTPGDTIPYDMVVYYSFITQATVGYGDMAPGTHLTRTISVLQALFGVIYIAVLISRLVSIHAARQMERRAEELESQKRLIADSLADSLVDPLAEPRSTPPADGHRAPAAVPIED